MDTACLNYRWSHALVAGFVAAGVREAVISPGARSTPLALALLRQTGLRCHIAVDERCAAFFALGLAKAQGVPSLLLATSGSAPAHWAPAVIEASHSNVPLLLLAADRPPELQQCGANQTIDQHALFAGHTRAEHHLPVPDGQVPFSYCHRLAAQSVEESGWPRPGPVYLNQPFREPLVPGDDCLPPPLPAPLRVSHAAHPPSASHVAELAERLHQAPGWIVCGQLPKSQDFAPALTALAQHLDCPVLAEPLSGLRFGHHDRSRILVRYDQWLDEPGQAALPKPAWILRFGSFPVGRPLQGLLNTCPAAHIQVDPLPCWRDPANRLGDLVRADPALFCLAMTTASGASHHPGWLDSWQQRDAPVSPQPSAITVIVDSLNDGDALFVSNSLAIRQLGLHSGKAGKAIDIFANRGASGIDGNIATALGIAAARGRVTALLGDLATQHDLGSLALASGQNATLITVNNGGGGIFEHLAQRQLPEFERGWKTPQTFQLSQAAAAFGLAYQRADTLAELADALSARRDQGGTQLIEFFP